MHIEPGIVDGAKLALSGATALAAFGLSAKASFSMIKDEGVLQLLTRSLIATLLVFIFFEVLPHHAVGVSEVHFILGSTLFLILGAAPAAIGLFSGLLLQGLLFAPFDLPQYGMNVTTLLIPLFAMASLARRLISENTAYVDVTYQQAFTLSLTYQGGIVAWVAFWAFYGSGFTVANTTSVLTFGIAYLSVVIIEPVLDLGVLAVAKHWDRFKASSVFEKRLYNAE